MALFTLIICMALLAAGSGYITDTGVLIPIIYTIIALSGFARGFYGPAVFGLTGDIVPRELYGNASAWNSAVWQGYPRSPVQF